MIKAHVSEILSLLGEQLGCRLVSLPFLGVSDAVPAALLIISLHSPR